MNKQITDAGIAGLSASPIEELDLSGCEQLTDACIPHLVKMRNLKSLNLRYTQLTDAGVAQLASVAGLRVLGLSSTRISDGCFEDLKRLTNLEELDIVNTKTTQKTLSRLNELQNLKGLKIGFETTATDLEYLKGLTHLSKLSVSASTVSNDELAHLSKLVNLVELDLYGCESLTDAGMIHLQAMTQLQKFGLPPKVTDAGLAKLKDAPIIEFLHDGHQSACSWEAKVRFIRKNKKPTVQSKSVVPPSPPKSEF
jgi:Leucine-rich repeat (LRR) protein